MALKSSTARTATATASSAMVNPLDFVIATSRSNDHDAVVDRGRIAGPVLIGGGRGRVSPLQVVVEIGRGSPGSVQRTAGKDEQGLLVVVHRREVVDSQAGQGDAAAATAPRQKVTGDRVVRLAIPLVGDEPADVRVGGFEGVIHEDVGNRDRDVVAGATGWDGAVDVGGQRGGISQGSVAENVEGPRDGLR